MDRIRVLALIFLAGTFGLRAGSSVSNAAELTCDDLNAGGGRLSGVGVVANTSLCPVGTLCTNISGACVLKSGYIGCLLDLASIQVSSAQTSVNESATCQFDTTGVYDDTSVGGLICAPDWSILSGPLVSIDGNGMATAGVVYEDTPAVVVSECCAVAGTAQVAVVNVNPDDFGIYSSDDLPDIWQVLNFGIGNTNAAAWGDPDDDGNDNMHEFVAGTCPTNPGSSFTVHIENVDSEPTRMNVVFSPAYGSRAYFVEREHDLRDIGGWNTLTNFAETTNGNERTVTDMATTNGAGFYRVRIVYSP